MTRPTRLIRMAPRPTAGGVEVDGDLGGTVQEALDTLGNDRWKQPCRVATTGTITISTGLNSGDTIDGVTLADGDRVLVKDQSTGSQNGIYVVSASPARATDFDESDEVLGARVHVYAGTANAGKDYRLTNTSAPTIGSTTLTFAEMSGGNSLDVTDGTTTVSPTTTIDFDPSFFDVTAPGGDVAAVTFVGSGSGITVEDEGTPLSTAADTLDFVGAGVTASGTGTTKTITIPGGGGSGTSPEWWDSPNAPGGGSDEEFVGNQVIGTLTRVNHGTPKGSWAEVADGLEWTQSANGTTELDVFAVPLTVSVGDYVTLVFQTNIYWENSKLGAFLGFSNGTTFGTSDAVGAFCTPSAPNVHLLNDWTNMNSRATDGNVVQETISYGTRWAVRVKLEASNTWGVYSRSAGGTWRTIQTNYSLSLSPTHAVFGVAMNANPTFTSTLPQRVRLECFRYND